MNVAFQFGSQAIALLALPRVYIKGTGMGTASFLGMVSILSLQVSHENETKSKYSIRAIATIAITIFISLGFIRNFKGKCLKEATRVLKEVFIIQAFTAIQLAIFSWRLGPNCGFRIREIPANGPHDLELELEPDEDYHTIAFDNPNLGPLGLASLDSLLNGWLFEKLTKTVPFPIKANERQKKTLRLFLARFKFDSGVNSRVGGLKPEELGIKLIEYLKRSNDNEACRTAFFKILTNATVKCTDRVALTIVLIDIELKKIEADITKPQSVKNLYLKTIWPFDLIRKKASIKLREILKTNPYFQEDVEVTLIYLVRLNRLCRLELPIEDMSFPHTSSVNGTDLNRAYLELEKELKDQNAFYEYLVKKEKWSEVLENSKYKGDLEKARKKRYKDYCGKGEEEANRAYYSTLIKLSKNLVY